MTSLGLLLWIILGVALQLGLFLGISFWQHWQSYSRLKQGLPEAEALSPEVSQPKPEVAGWSGFRSFRVARRVIEDSCGANLFFPSRTRRRAAPSVIQARSVPDISTGGSQGRWQRNRADHPLLLPVGRSPVGPLPCFDQAGTTAAEERSSSGALLEFLPRPCSGRHDTSSPSALGALLSRTGQQPHRPDRRRDRHHPHAQHAQLVPVASART